MAPASAEREAQAATSRGLARHERTTSRAARAEGHAHRDLVAALRHGVGEHAVDADGGQQQREPREERRAAWR